MIKPIVEVVRKKVSSKVEIVAGKVKSVTLPLPLVKEKGTCLVIHLPEPTLRELIKQAKTLPKALRVRFIQDWFMENQAAAFRQYQKSKSKKFNYDNVPVKPPLYTPLANTIPEKITQLLAFGSGSKSDPYKVSLPVSTIVRLTKLGQTNVNLPLIIDLENAGTIYFTIKLKLGQLADASISSTSSSIVNILRKQITDWAVANDINTTKREFKSSLQDAMSVVAPNIRQQVKRMRVKHPEWSKL